MRTVEARTQRRMPLALATVALVAVVLLVVAALIGVRLASSSSAPGPPPTPAAPGGLVAELSRVPGSVLNTVGAPGPPVVRPPTTVPSAAALRHDGRPEVVYVGAEFCPFCAAERLALVVALGRFGHFSALGLATSSRQLVFPGTPSVSFRGASYTSPWLAFEPTETYSARGTQADPDAFAALQGVPAAAAALVRHYDVPPLAPVAGALPFVDIGGRTVVVGAGFSPAVLSGLSIGTVAGDLSSPTSRVAQAVDGTANELTAAICAATGGQPTSVCRSPAAQAGSARLTAGAG